MGATTSTAKRASSPCGCSGPGVAKASPCSCGGSCGGTCSTCQTEGYSRPRFFAGQLLTEDDLQQLGDYIVAKNRLHARHLFGAGVVCGLEVTCFPCGGGKVIVNPGYALDCCGNDIVLACPQELDINQMVRDLQRRMRGGFDCGDPCADTQQGTPASKDSVGDQPAETVSRGAGEKPVRRHQKYCLYVNYCEQQSDPVSPYVTDDPCTPQSCEATRIREGFRFELRCPDDSESVPEICARYRDCLGDPVAAAKTQKDSHFLEQYGKRIVAAQEAIHKNPAAPSFEPSAFLKQLSLHDKTLRDLYEKLPHDVQKISSALAQDFADAAVSVASDIACYYFHYPSFLQKTYPSAEEIPQEIYSEVRNAVELLKESLPSIHSMVKGTSPAPFETQLAKDYAVSLTDLLPRLFETEPLAGGKRAARPEVESLGEVRGVAAGPPAVPLAKETLRWLAEGVLAARTFYNSAISSLDDLRAFLISRLQQEALKTHCSLLDSVAAAPEPKTVHNVDPGLSEMHTLGRAVGVLTSVLGRLYQACFCNALNPPCPPCEDPGVLLACLTLEDCKVKDICNLDRQFVLSPLAIRYWIPEITRIGRGIEKACCPDLCEDERSPDTGGSERDHLRMDPDLAYAGLVASTLIWGCEEYRKTRPPLASSFLKSFLMRSLRDFPGGELVRGAAPFPFRVVAATAPIATEDVPTVSELASRLQKAYSEYEKLRVDFTRLSDKLGRLERKMKNPE